jgi:hypothetical protein
LRRRLIGNKGWIIFHNSSSTNSRAIIIIDELL